MTGTVVAYKGQLVRIHTRNTNGAFTVLCYAIS